MPGSMSLPWVQQCLDTPFDGSVPDLLEAVAGLNAQTALGPAVGIWARMGPWSAEVVDDLCRSFELVKVNVMRGTVHLLTARQYWAWRPALKALLRRNVASFCSGLWSRVDYDELLNWGTDFVSDGRQLTRGELGDAAVQRFADASSAHLGFALRMILPLVEVPPPSIWRPVRTRYVYAPAVMTGSPADPDEGLDDLARSFACAFGSAAVDDFSYWSGLTKIEASQHRAALSDASSASRCSTPPRAVVLPEFDNLFFCRRSSYADLYAAKKDPRFPPARMPGSLIANGEVVGHWSASRTDGLRLVRWTELDPTATGTWVRFARWYATS